ncbi:MAG: HDOD domain-containing protein [Opitutae bacterium]|nr:HDOD domain-containing protein [Opitutae bacterium]
MSSVVANMSAASPASFTDAEISRRIDACPKLASLSSINRALGELLKSDQSINSQIAEVIRRDPSLTARLLRMVNSVFFDLTAKVNNIEEAVFYLGVRQIRELSRATPVIEELEKMPNAPAHLPWRELWKHSIGSAIMTREILATTTTMLVDDDTDYIIGLLHNVGKVVLATTFPEQFSTVVATPARNTMEICALERATIGWDHARAGAYYLQRHRLAPEIVNAVLHHNDPENAGEHACYAAAVQVADQLVRAAGISGGFEQVEPMPEGAWPELSGWGILYGAGDKENLIARAALAHSLQRLPMMLNGLV